MVVKDRDSQPVGWEQQPMMHRNFDSSSRSNRSTTLSVNEQVLKGVMACAHLLLLIVCTRCV